MIISKSHFLFPRQVISTTSERFSLYRDKLQELCYNYMRTDPEKRIRSNRLGYQSKQGSFHAMNEFKFLFDDLDDLIMHCLKEEFHAKDGVQYYIDCSFLNIMPTGSFNHAHIHPGSHMSCVYYVKVPENSGNIVFVCPNEYLWDKLSGCRRDEYIKQNDLQTKFEITPKEGMFLMFPSSLTHLVEANLSEDDRISIVVDINLSKKDEVSMAYGW
jgi:uncharacterized protein (TIGR02466 family)